MDVESHRCPSVYSRFDHADRLLTITIERVDQDPRPDSLFDLLSTPR
jgi:hypothetical protein